jgi:hypothetical protein
MRKCTHGPAYKVYEPDKNLVKRRIFVIEDAAVNNIKIKLKNL